LPSAKIAAPGLVASYEPSSQHLDYFQPFPDKYRIFIYKPRGEGKNNSGGGKPMLIRNVGLIICLTSVLYSAYALKFVAYGDTRDNPTTHKSVVDRFAAEKPEVVLHVGDLSGTDSNIPNFTNVIAGNTTADSLWKANLFLVGRGNHESWTALRNISPTMVRNNTEKYYFSMGNCFFVCLGYDGGSDLTWLKTALATPAAKAAKWRIAWGHTVCWNTSGRVMSNLAAVKAVFDTMHVNLVFYGHDHYYQRSYLMKRDVVCQTGNAYRGDSGTVGQTVGDGGAPLYSIATKPSWCSYQNNTIYGYTLITANDTMATITHKNSSGTVVDQYTWIKSGPITGTVAGAPAAVPQERQAGITAIGNNRFVLTSAANSRYEVVAVDGRVVLSGPLGGTAGAVIDLSKVRKGLYFARIWTPGHAMVRRLVVR
jgi:predicted phosphodiesterase